MQRQILIVEDNPADIRLMQEALLEIQPPVSAHIATETIDALAYLRCQGIYAAAQRPRLIFLDFNLPMYGSRELLRAVKEDEELRVIPVAVFTTSEAETDIREAYRLRANCYLKKPVDLDGFFTTIHSAAHFWLNVACTVGNVPCPSGT